MSHYGVHDADVVIAALLHDAVEDHAAELAAGQSAGSGADGTRQAALAALAAEFGPRVAELVAAVTNPEYAADRDAHEQYREHVADSLRRDPWARVIKASDFTDNGVGLIHTTGPRLRTLASKYAPLVPILRELIDLPDTPLDETARRHIRTQLDRAAERFAAVLPSGEVLPGCLLTGRSTVSRSRPGPGGRSTGCADARRPPGRGCPGFRTGRISSSPMFTAVAPPSPWPSGRLTNAS